MIAYLHFTLTLTPNGYTRKEKPKSNEQINRARVLSYEY